MKIDVEGYELFVLRPFLDFIDQTYRPEFLVELGWGKSNPNWPDSCPVAAELVARGYRFLNARDTTAELSLSDLAASTGR